MFSKPRRDRPFFSSLLDLLHPRWGWADALKGRAHVNVAAVAMANKMARIAWAVLTKGERYRPNAMSSL